MGIVKRPGDAIRYIEEKNLTVEEIFKEYIESQQRKNDITEEQ